MKRKRKVIQFNFLVFSLLLTPVQLPRALAQACGGVNDGRQRPDSVLELSNICPSVSRHFEKTLNISSVNALDTFETINGKMTFGRSGHHVAELGQGKLIVASGAWGDLGGEQYAEKLSYESDQIQSVPLPMVSLRSSPAVIRFADGKILYTGGGSDFELAQKSTEFYDPQKNHFYPGPDLVYDRSSHTATLLPDGKVLITGGQNERGVLGSLEIYDPSQNTFSVLKAHLGRPRANHTASLIENRFVVIAGGQDYDRGANNKPIFMDSIEVFDTATQLFLKNDAKLASPRCYHSFLAIPNLGVLLLGGLKGQGETIESVELVRLKLKGNRSSPSPKDYLHSRLDKASQKTDIPLLRQASLGVEVKTIGKLSTSRVFHTSTLIDSERFFIAGGISQGTPLKSTEICRIVRKSSSQDNDIPREKYNSQKVTTELPLLQCDSSAALNITRWMHEAILDQEGKLMLVGGLTSEPEKGESTAGPSRSIESFKIK